jgi:L-cystine transport system ATP-binding protein
LTEGQKTQIQLRGVYKSYGKTPVLKGIDLSVAKGEVIAILGPSGAGKSTLLRCINFLERADAGTLRIGSIYVDFRSVTQKQILEIRKKTSFVFQNFNLFRHRTVIENVTEGLVIARGIALKEATETAMEALEKVGLPDRKDAYPHQLSGGQQQRVAIARAIALNSDVVLMDEPTSALDAELIDETLQIIQKIAREGITMIIVTHEISFAIDVAHHILFMENGAVVEEGPPQEIILSPKEERTKQFFRRIQSSFTYTI